MKNRWLLVVLWLVIVGIGGRAPQAQKVTSAPIIDVRFEKRTVLVADPNKRTLTLIPGMAGTWVCASHEGGKSCKSLDLVASWLLQNADEREP